MGDIVEVVDVGLFEVVFGNGIVDFFDGEVGDFEFVFVSVDEFVVIFFGSWGVS